MKTGDLSATSDDASDSSIEDGVWRYARASKASLIVDGEALPADHEFSAEFHRGYDPAYAPYKGKLVCAQYEKKGATMMSTVWSDGVLQPVMGGDFIWVKPEAYRLAAPE